MRARLRALWYRYLETPWARLTGGLPDTGERIDPRRPSPLLEAHAALYHLAARHAPEGARILDVGCGAGYGAAILAPDPSRTCLGFDRDPAAIAFARRRYGAAHRSFEVLEVAQLAARPGSLGHFQLVVASNCMEHFQDALGLVGVLAGTIAPGGSLLIAIPPSDGTHDGNPHHLSLHPAPVWETAMARHFVDVETRAHLGFGLPAAQQAFPPRPAAELGPGKTVTAVLVGRGPRAG